jgi:endonuclease/exonuclease/phosphatase family metal-dependent hydrolase
VKTGRYGEETLMKYSTFANLGALSTIFLLCFGPMETSSAEDRPLRIMSYNIAAGHGDIDGIVAVIRAERPDIVALQEVDVHWSERSDFVDQARYLAEALGMHYFYAPIYTFTSDDGPPRQYGLAFLSIRPLEAKVNHELTRLSTQEAAPAPRPEPGFPEIQVTVNGEAIRIFNTHLDYRSDPSVRISQIAEMLEIMGPLDRPKLLVGDLNARPYAAELEPLFSVFEDAWAGQSDPGYTFPSTGRDRRIDYILHTDHCRVDRVYIVETTASDHVPVVADLICRPR